MVYVLDRIIVIPGEESYIVSRRASDVLCCYKCELNNKRCLAFITKPCSEYSPINICRIPSMNSGEFTLSPNLSYKSDNYVSSNKYYDITGRYISKKLNPFSLFIISYIKNEIRYEE